MTHDAPRRLWRALLAGALVSAVVVTLLPPSSPARAVEAVSEETGTLTGTFLNTGGVPFTGSASQVLFVSNYTVAVAARRMDDGPGGEFYSQNVRGDGSFTLSNMRPGSYFVSFQPQHPLFSFTYYPGGLYWEEAVHVAVGAGETVEIVDTLIAKGSIALQVQQSDGTPISPSSVQITELVHVSAAGQKVVDPFGGYVLNRNMGPTAIGITRLLPGSYYVRYSAGADYEQAYYPGVATLAEAQPIVVAPGQDVTGVIGALPRRPSLSGTVMIDGPEGPVPAVGARVSVRGWPLQTAAFATTDATGSWRVDRMPQTGYRVCVTEGPSYPATSRSFVDACAGQDEANPTGALQSVGWGEQKVDVDVAPEAAIRVYGRVRVALDGLAERDAKYGDVRFWRNEGPSGWTFAGSTELDNTNGWFRSPPLDPGTYRVEYRLSNLRINTSTGDGYTVYVRGYHGGSDLFINADDVEVGEVSVRLPGDYDSVVERGIGVSRVKGEDRFGTAVSIAEAFEATPPVPVIYVVNGLGYADALSAGPAAASQGGLMLLTLRDRLPATTEQTIVDLQPQRIVIVGGAGVVSTAVENRLRELTESPDHVVRLGGTDRYDTSRLIVDDAFGASGVPALFLATGRNFPDALAAGPAASYLGGAVLLVDGARPALDAPTMGMIDDLDPQSILLAGMRGSISTGIESELTRRDPSPESVVRLGGSNRYSTALAINSAVFDDPEYAFMASGTGFADALAGGPLAAAYGAPLYLSPGPCVHDSTWVQLFDTFTARLVLLGGGGVLAALDRAGAGLLTLPRGRSLSIPLCCALFSARRNPEYSVEPFTIPRLDASE